MRQTINNGATEGDGTGESIRSAMTKTNNMFLELYGNNHDSVTAVSGTIDLTAAVGVEKSKKLLSAPLGAANTLIFAGPDVNTIDFAAPCGPAICALTFQGIDAYGTFMTGSGDVIQVPADTGGDYVLVHATKIGTKWMATIQLLKASLS
jgi:hypothetical protein